MFHEMSIWELREVLLDLNLIALSRMQIHVILQYLEPNDEHMVDVHYFIRVVCAIIPRLFDAGLLASTAQLIAAETVEIKNIAELRELEAFVETIGAAMPDRGSVRDIDDDPPPDRDHVEKALCQIFQMYDKEHTADHTLLLFDFLAALSSEHVAVLRLTPAEVRGFIAELEPDDSRVRYLDHVKKWVPILFDLRKCKVYHYLVLSGVELLADLREYEVAFPVMRLPSPSESSHASRLTSPDPMESGRAPPRTIKRIVSQQRQSITTKSSPRTGVGPGSFFSPRESFDR